MRFRATLLTLLFLVAAGTAGYYAFRSFRESSRPPTAGRSPDLNLAPVRLYGLLEPCGREIFVGAPVAERGVGVLRKEGARVATGQVLVQLDANVEQASLRVAQAAVEEARARVALAEDELHRLTQIVSANAVSQTELSRAALTRELEKTGAREGARRGGTGSRGPGTVDAPLAVRGSHIQVGRQSWRAADTAGLRTHRAGSPGKAGAPVR